MTSANDWEYLRNHLYQVWLKKIWTVNFFSTILKILDFFIKNTFFTPNIDEILRNSNLSKAFMYWGCGQNFLKIGQEMKVLERWQAKC